MATVQSASLQHIYELLAPLPLLVDPKRHKPSIISVSSLSVKAGAVCH